MEYDMNLGYYPGWTHGFVAEYFDELKRDGQRKKAEAKLRGDLLSLQYTWPRPVGVDVKILRGHEPMWELIREYQGIAYRVFFCVKGQDIWLLHAIEKKKMKTPPSDLNVAYTRMQNVLSGRVRR
jgi:phage-related protein